MLTRICLREAVTALDPQDDSSSGGGGTSLTIADCEEILTDAQLGDSIAVNGTNHYQKGAGGKETFTTPRTPLVFILDITPLTVIFWAN